jgi:hypothetical protein
VHLVPVEAQGLQSDALREKHLGELGVILGKPKVGLQALATQIHPKACVGQGQERLVPICAVHRDTSGRNNKNPKRWIATRWTLRHCKWADAT